MTSAGTATEEVAGDAALLVDPHDPASVTAALDRVLDEPGLAADLRRRGRARAATTYTWERSAELTAAAYAEAGRASASTQQLSETGTYCVETGVAARVGVNLLWLVPGVVGGSEEYTTRLLAGLAEHRRADLHLTLFVLEPFVAAHPDLVAAFPPSPSPSTASQAAAGRGREHLAARAGPASRRIDLVHHAGGVVPPGRRRRRRS